MFQTMLPKPSFAMVMPGGMSIMVLSFVLDENCDLAGSTGEECGDVLAGGGRFLEHQVSGRRHKLEMAVGQARHPGLRLCCGAQTIIRASQLQRQHSDAKQAVDEL